LGNAYVFERAIDVVAQDSGQKKKGRQRLHNLLSRSQTVEVPLNSTIFPPSSSLKDQSFQIQTDAPQPVVCPICLIYFFVKQMKM
jgi:hypothetical protein